MPKLLSVLVSPRGDYSISRSLAKTFTDEWTSKNAGGEVVTRDLCNTKLPCRPPLDRRSLQPRRTALSPR